MVSRNASIRDVAKLAGVSVATVSRVLSRLPSVDKKNILKVEAAVVALKFRPNISAQRLVKGSNNTIGLVIPSYPGVFHSFYGIELIRGVGHACEVARQDLVLHITDGRNALNIGYLGGAVFADIIENSGQIRSALASGVPCVVINNVVRDMAVSYIAVNNYKGGELAARHFVALGHVRIATITGNLKTQAGFERLDGFMKALEDSNISVPEEYVFRGDYSRYSARAGAERLFNLKNRPTAIFAQSDDMALEVIAVAHERRLRVPEDISVIGFDDSPQGMSAAVGLTSIRQPVFEMAERGVHLLMDLVSGRRKENLHLLLEPELVLRDSCAARPAMVRPRTRR